MKPGPAGAVMDDNGIVLEPRTMAELEVLGLREMVLPSMMSELPLGDRA